MKLILQTPRLYLREFQIADAEKMYNLSIDPAVIKYTGNDSFTSISDAKKFLLSYGDYEENGFGRWAVINKENDEFLGWCGLKQHKNGFVDIDFRFFREQWGRGYATESAKACLEYGFKKLQLKEIIGRVDKENKASVKVLEKLGMGYFKKDKCHRIENALYYKIASVKK